MKLHLYINGLLWAEEPCATDIDIYETVALWYIKHELKRRMHFEIFLLLPSKMNSKTDYETTDTNRLSILDRD